MRRRSSMAEVASKIAVPIATGERFISLRELQVLMSRHAAQYIRPDVCAVGGITASKKICACIPNLGIQELPGFCLNGAEDAMVKEPFRYEDGCLLIPEAPGIGIELADNAEELYPLKERGSNTAKRAFDGSVKDF